MVGCSGFLLLQSPFTVREEGGRRGSRAKERQKELVNRKAAGKAGERRSELMKPPRQVLQGVKHGHCFCLACERVCVCVCMWVCECLCARMCLCPHGLCVSSLEAVDEPL